MGSGERLSALHPVAFDATHSGLPCRCCGDVFHVPAHASLQDLQAVGRARNAHELARHSYVHVAVLGAPLIHIDADQAEALNAHVDMNECLMSGICAGHMREGLIDIKVGGTDDCNANVLWAEVWHQGELVHRSVRVNMKQGISSLLAAGEIH